MTSQALNRPVDVIGVLDAAGANPYAEEGSPAWELARLGAAVAELIDATKGVLPFVVYQVLEHCDGNKCRDSWCAGCSGEEQAEASVDEANRNSQRLYTALAAIEVRP